MVCGPRPRVRGHMPRERHGQPGRRAHATWALALPSPRQALVWDSPCARWRLPSWRALARRQRISSWMRRSDRCAPGHTSVAWVSCSTGFAKGPLMDKTSCFSSTACCSVTRGRMYGPVHVAASRQLAAVGDDHLLPGGAAGAAHSLDGLDHVHALGDAAEHDVLQAEGEGGRVSWLSTASCGEAASHQHAPCRPARRS